MAVLKNSLDGGTNATAISTGNSGGVSGDAFGLANGSAVYSNTHAHSGTLAARFPLNTLCTLGWDIATTDLYTRHYLWAQVNAAQTLILLWASSGASGSSRGRLEMATDGTLLVGNASGSTTSLGATPVTLNQWVRIECRFSTTTGCEARLYNSADSDVIAASATHASSMGSSVGSLQFRNGGAESQDAWLDDIAISTDGWLGPAVDPAPRPPLVARTAVHRASRW